MKPQTTFHEILLLTGTKFSNRQFCKRDANNNNHDSLSSLEELEKACWDGLIYEMFPEVIGSFSDRCKSFIWHIMSGKNFLNVSIGPIPPVINSETAIDPYFSMTKIREN